MDSFTKEHALCPLCWLHPLSKMALWDHDILAYLNRQQNKSHYKGLLRLCPYSVSFWQDERMFLRCAFWSCDLLIVVHWMQEMTDSEWMLIRFQALSCVSLSGFCIDQDWCEADSLRLPDLCSLFFFSFCLSCSLSRVFLLPPSRLLLLLSVCLFPESFLSLSRCTHESRCRHVVFITRSLPAGLGLAVIGWLMRMSRLNMQHFPFSSLSHQEMDQSQPKEFEHALMGRLYAHTQICRLARWSFRNASVFSFSPFSCRPAA